MRSDVDRYRDRAAPVDLAGIDFDAFRDQPLPPEVIRCLRYMHDVEHHTICYLRDLLVTPAHRDPAVTTFLTVWSYEEMWHGQAIGRVLAAHDQPHGAGRVGEMRRRLGVRDRLSPLLHSLGSSLAGDTFPAVHMAWGAVNEWTTQAGYARLIDRARHPVLTDLLSRIMRQEGRHIAFYAAEAERRLAGSRRAQRLCRAALRRPVAARRCRGDAPQRSRVHGARAVRRRRGAGHRPPDRPACRRATGPRRAQPGRAGGRPLRGRWPAGSGFPDAAQVGAARSVRTAMSSVGSASTNPAASPSMSLASSDAGSPLPW